MSNEVIREETFLRSYGWLVLLTLALSAFTATYALNQIPFSLPAILFVTYTIPIAVMFWVVWDAKSRRCTPCFDFGLLVYMGWLVVIPGYLLWTRGWRGMLVLAGFVLLFLLPWFVAILLYPGNI